MQTNRPAELPAQREEATLMTLSKVVRKGSYQGVAQWGISTSSEITPSKATAQKWAALENARAPLGRSKAAKSRKVEISFHSDSATGSNAHPAINVKVQRLPWVEVSEDARTAAYDQTVEQFWISAGLIAQNHGYSAVFSEGRSSGWMAPFTQHNAAGKLVTTWTGQGPGKGYPVYPNVEDKAERRQFVEFRTDIETLLKESIAQYQELALDLAKEGQAN
jgi:hypothetical protein